MEDVEKQDGNAKIDYFARMATEIQKAFESGSIKTARDGKTLTYRPWRKLRLIPKAKARHWSGEEDVDKKLAFMRKAHSEPERTYDWEGNPAQAT